MKRVFDIVLASVGLVLASPILLFMIIWVRLDSKGLAIFRQQRVGRGEKLFEIWKIRTMYLGVEGPFISPKGDERVTRAGRVLRRSKLDELPQLWNVLRGDMSLVGPRPEVPKYVAHYSKDERAVIFALRPGITNPGSILFFDEPEWLAEQADPEAAYINELLPKKLDCYRRYAREQSMLLDLKVLLRTLWRLIAE
jgi:lipopolysaccharide/colanic/teichoic acid biosynthesis glycosyltransferase